MKITISKSQWEEMGKKAGWIRKPRIQRLKMYRQIDRDEDGGIVDTEYSYKPLAGYEGFYIDVEAEFESGTKGGLYEEPIPPHWLIYEVKDAETDEDLSNVLDMDRISQALGKDDWDYDGP